MDQFSVKGVPPETAARMLDAGDALLVDVREPEEWCAGRAPQAVHIPLGDLPERLGDVPGDRNLIMACRSGGRSARAALALVELGFPAFNLEGGMQAWEAASLPVVADGGLPGVVA